MYRKKNNIVFILLLIFIALFANNSFADQYKKFYYQAVELARAGQVAEGERLLSTLISRKQRAANLYIWRGRFRLGYVQNHMSAIADFNIAEKLSSAPRVEIHWFRGDCYYNLKMYNQAIVDYSKAIRLNPRRAKMYYFRAKAYAKVGMIERSKNDLKSLVKYGPGYQKKAEDLYLKILQGKRDF